MPRASRRARATRPSPIRSDSWPATVARQPVGWRPRPDEGPDRGEPDDRRVAIPLRYQEGARTFGHPGRLSGDLRGPRAVRSFMSGIGADSAPTDVIGERGG